ncbi:MAG: hypothetical protein CO001_00680 [Candidatus Portnoybacteria bacterium CG_4_8_14_3_um_filter_40_10]|uniref:ROK family protein n=1 Tax=Candidatus Portnoybacteria bacterium CG_4_8_14_3_um_filter_40_10 TaxID=1974801 RepID=A0A2M7IJ85_9BACT|nr:MAG: hypothetical protein CO001_00680 [Candidatus Portnoybacteria bacterium CG_4_8_14_3_um_filter_40_10]
MSRRYVGTGLEIRVIRAIINFMYYLGFDIGAYSIKAALVNEKKIIDSKIQETPNSLEKLIEVLEKNRKELTEGKSFGELAGIGVGVAGILDRPREIVLKSPNIPCLDNQPLKKILEEHFKPTKVKIEHDVHCFLAAEKAIGQAQNLHNIYYLTIGSGVGGAWTFEGKTSYGAHGSTGDVGHTIINNEKGLNLEDLASNKFIEKSLAFGSLGAEKKIAEGDEKTKKTMEELGKNLGIGIANIINMFDPETVILSGGISWAESILMPGIRYQMQKYVVSPAAKETNVFFSRLGRYGGALGAAMLFNE